MEATGTDVPAAIDSFADVSSSKFDPQTYCALGQNKKWLPKVTVSLFF